MSSAHRETDLRPGGDSPREDDESAEEEEPKKTLCQSLPSIGDVCRALTLSNIGHFFISPLWAALVFFLLGLYTNSVLQVVADRQVVECGEETCPPLPDLGHEFFPHLTFVKICDYWLYAFVGGTILRFSPIFVSKSLSLVILRRWAFLQGCLFWMRGISVALTRQSVPQEDCITTATGNAWMEGLYIMTGVHITCGDIMYSGHTAGITLCTLIWTHYSKGEEFSICCGERRPFITPNLDAVGDPATCSLTSLVVWALAFTGFFFIIATHFHYSNDVFIGCLITQFIFAVYHYYVKTLLELPGWWAAVFRWFEGFNKSLKEQLPTESDAAAAAAHQRRMHKGGGGLVSPREGINSPLYSPGGHEAAYSHGGGGLGPFEENARVNTRDNEHQAVQPLGGVGVSVFSEGPTKEQQQANQREAKSGKEGLLGKKTTNGGGGSSPAASEDYEYHAMESGDARPNAQPVVVAGEIAEQKSAEKTQK